MDKPRPTRNDILDKVTGKTKYGGDVRLENMLHAKVLFAPVPRARIVKIDTAAAEQAPGVVCVATRKDIRGPAVSGRIGAHVFDHPVLVGEGETVQNGSDALALVAAETEEEAARALGRIRVEYEELPGVHTVEQAKEQGMAPACERVLQKGDAAQALAQAALVVEDTYFTPFAEHAYLEPECGYAFVDADGTVNVCAATQDLRQQQRMACQALGLPFSKLRQVSPAVGGAFGGKHSMTVHVHLALLALLTNRPVRLVWTREESLCHSCKKQSFETNVKLGTDAEGRITALWARVEGPASPYKEKSLGRLNGFCNALLGPYRQPNIDLLGRMYHTTCPEIGAFRGVGAPDGAFVMETLLNKAAEALGISQEEIRRRNFLTGDEIPGQFEGILLRNLSPKWIIAETLDEALKAAGPPPQPAPGKRVGRGVASAMAAFAIGNTDTHKGSVVELAMQLDGTLVASLGFPELGQGVTGVVGNLVAEQFGLPREQITLQLSDSFQTPPAGALGFSQATVTAGNAALDACRKLKELLADTARACLGSDDPSIHYAAGRFVNGSGEEALGWAAFAEYCYIEVKRLWAAGCVVGPPEDKNLIGATPVSCVADVEADPATGEMRVLQIITCHDIGALIQPESARGQVLGSVVMALGGLQMEEFMLEDGRVRTPSLAEYLIPTALDIPGKNEVVFLEGNKAAGCPLGAKGLGEHGMYAAAAAAANALYNAVGARVTRLPATPESILRSLGAL